MGFHIFVTPKYSLYTTLWRKLGNMETQSKMILQKKENKNWSLCVVGWYGPARIEYPFFKENQAISPVCQNNRCLRPIIYHILFLLIQYFHWFDTDWPVQIMIRQKRKASCIPWQSAGNDAIKATIYINVENDGCKNALAMFCSEHQITKKANKEYRAKLYSNNFGKS